MASRADLLRAPARPGARERGAWCPLLSGAVAALFAAPAAYLVMKNLSAPRAFWSAVSDSGALAALGRSLLLATTVCLSASVVGTLAAWAVTRTDVWGRRLWRLLLPLPLVIPSFTGAFVLLAAFAPGGVLEALLAPLGVGRLPSVRGFAGSFVVLTLFTYPYVYLPVAARLRQLPASLEESAALLGTRARKVFWTIVLPQARGAILAGALLVFLYTVGEFGVVQLMRYDTVTRVIYSTRLLDQATSLALSLQLGVVAALVVGLERLVTRGGNPESRRTSGALQIRLGRWRLPAAVSLGSLVGLALGTPVAVLAWWTGRGLLAGSAPAGSLTAGSSGLLAPVVNTAAVSIAAALGAALLVLPVAYLTVRRRSAVGAVANVVVVGGFALPGLAVALAIVFWATAAPGPLGLLYQTTPLLVLAYVVHFGAMALRSAQAALASIPAAVEDAARVLGASAARRFLAVELPLMAPGLLAGGGLVLLSSMKELPATLLLTPPGFQTLATRIWGATESAFFVDASIASLLLIALSGVLTWLLVIRRTDGFV